MTGSASSSSGNAAQLRLHRDARHVTIADTCMVIGALFSRKTFRPADPAELKHFKLLTIGEIAADLIENYWGAYAALFFDEDRRELAILPDPSGFLPIYLQPQAESIFVTTEPDLTGGQVSYMHLASHLLRPELRQRETCLQDVVECVPGALTYLNACLESERLWKPETFSLRPDSPYSENVDRLRSTSVKVLSAWADFFGTPAVASSGGVDSSLVCASLSVARTAFGCITIATTDDSGDERDYAGAVADMLGVRCIQRTYRSGLLNPENCASRGLPRPSRRLFVSAIDLLLEEGRQELGADVVFDGGGGDNLFCFLHSAAPVVDSLRAKGLTADTLATLLDMCRITDCSVPAMLKAVARRYFGVTGTEAWSADAGLLTATAADAATLPLTPWLESWTPARSGRLDHLKLLMQAQNHTHGINDIPHRFSPLASQPLVELCLGIPSWQWAKGGINRAPARDAFADALPAAIVQRISKAGPDSFVRSAFAANRSIIRERLLDGLLVQNRIVDRGALEEALTVDETRDNVFVDRIMDLLEAENWARSWAN